MQLAGHVARVKRLDIKNVVAKTDEVDSKGTTL
jgi:hypothetical protein